MDEKKPNVADFLRGATLDLDKDLDPYLAEHCQRSPMTRSDGSVVHDVIYDVEASNLLCQYYLEKKQRQAHIQDSATKGSSSLVWKVALVLVVIAAIAVAILLMNK